MQTMKCVHTGLPMVMCGHCNGTHALDIDPITGMAQDEEPHKGKGVWKGKGQATGVMGVDKTVVTNNRFDTMRGRSGWARSNSMRTLASSGFDCLGDIDLQALEAVKALLGAGYIEPEPIEGIGVGLGDKPPKNRQSNRPKEPVIGHARSSGRAGNVLYSRKKAATDRQ